MPEPPRILEWYRADPWPRMRRVLLVGPMVLTLGGLAVAVSFLTRQPADVRALSVGVGFALVIGGAAFTLASMHAILRSEVSLVLRTDGVFVQSARSRDPRALGRPARRPLGRRGGGADPGEVQRGGRGGGKAPRRGWSAPSLAAQGAAAEAPDGHEPAISDAVC